ncbi:MAG: PAS domain S-box protein [Methanomicrobiales archaeon]
MTGVLRVLYVDDEHGLLEIGKMFLEHTGDISVKTIDSAISALSLLKTEQFDAIISDYQMPDMDGIQLLKTVRNSGNNIPFILFTGKGREDVVIQALNEGADFYLQKGGDPQAQFVELTHKIKMAIYRKWAERALNQSEERFRSVMNQLPGTVWAVDSNLRFTLSQGAGLAEIGLKPDKAVGKTLYEFFNTSDPDHPEISHHLRALTGESTVYDYTYEGITFRTYLSPLYDAQGTITGVTGLAFDITEQTRTEEAFRESERRYRNVVEDQTELISRFLPDGTHIFVNEAYCRYFGFARHDILGHRFRPKIPSEDQERINKFFRSLAQDNQVDTIEHRIVMPDGTIRWQRWSDRAIFDASGTIIEYQSVGRDVTEIKEAEEERLKSESKFHLLFDNSILGIFQTTPEGRYLTMNLAFAQIYGYDSPEEMMSAIHDIQKQLYVNPEVRQIFNRSLSEAGEVRNFEMQNWHRDGHSIWITTNARVIRNTNGKIIAYEGTIEDITERKRAEEALRKSEERLELALSVAQMGTWDLDLKRHTAWRSLRHDQIFGYDSLLPEWTYEMFLEHVLPEDRDLVDHAFNEAQSCKHDWEFECRIRRTDGEIRWIWARGKIEFSPIGEQNRMLGLVQDITERRKEEDILRISEMHLKRAEEIGRSGSWEIRLNDHSVTASEGAKILYGLEGAQFTLEAIQKIPIAGYRPLLNTALKDLIAGKSPYNVEFKIQRQSDGAVLDIHSVAEYNPQENAVIGVIHDITERKKVAEALKENESRYRTYIDNSPVGIFIVDSLGKYRDVNPYACSMLGYSREELLSLSVYDINPDQPGRSNNFSTLQVKGSLSREIQLRKKNGDYLNVMMNASALPQGGYLGSCTDITDLKRAEADLQSSEETLSAMLNGITESAFLMLLDGTILAANETAAKRLGFARGEDIVGLNSYSVLPPELCEERKSKVQEVLRSGQMVQYENVGSGTVFNNILNPVIDPDGKIRRLAILGQNITERKQVEEASRESEAKFRDFFNNAGDAIVIHDMQGHFLEVNDEICRRLGYSREELLKMSPSDIDEPEYGNMVQARVQELQQTGHVVFETAHHAKDGTRIPAEVSSRVITYNGKPAIISNGRDITDRKKAEQAILQSNRQLKLLTGITRHDILNKITTILRYISLAEMELKNPLIAEYLSKIELATRAIRSQIEFTKVYENLGTHEPLWQDLNIIIALSPHLPPTLKLNSNVKGTEIYADPMLERVFFNLLDNSVRHGEHVTNIRVSIEKSNNTLTIIWEDNGVGIPVEEKEKIFERGFGKNTGLGMFLVREILSLTGITIKENGEPGKGVRFEITVPKGMYRIK